ncbi:nucleotide kinase domain-containing protein [Dickeya dianthicola]|uniref:nucleotide kinase domain-containing protein n=1 Tax=Dickeya dianthicola TaxID=204039 RepID=UPI00301A2D70
MNNKNDQLFCNVREMKIKTAKPILNEIVIREWFYHQRERTSIYYKKEILNIPPYWTDDKILRKYKFVNTKRTWDRETKWLLKNVINNDSLSYENKILNSFLFRVINKSDTLIELNAPFNFSRMTLCDINEKIREKIYTISIRKPRYVFFSAAYILGGPKVSFGKYVENIEGATENDMVTRMIKFVYYNQDKIVNGVKSSANQLEVFEHLKSFSGIGDFLAYQIFIDLTYITNFPFTELNFVVSGPGCERGINWIFSNRDGMNSEECLFWFTINQSSIAEKYHERWEMDEIFHFLPKEERIYTLMDMENSGACEIDKRCRTKFSNKRPKQKYHYNNNNLRLL